MPVAVAAEPAFTMHKRDLTGTTLKDFAVEVDDTSRPLVVATTEVSFRIEEDHENPLVILGSKEIPLDSTATEALCGFLHIPKPFWKRLQPDERQYIATSRMLRTEGTASFMLTKEKKVEHLVGIHDTGKPPINPRRLVEVAMETMSPNALVYDYRKTVEDFSFDCYVPEDSKRQVIGDKAVGDLSYGGITIGQDRKRNLSPYVAPWFMRLLCTNGFEVQAKEREEKVDGRKCETVEEVIGQLEALANTAFSRVEGLMTHFYDLRSRPVKNVERTLRNMAKERGMSARMVTALEDLAPLAFGDIAVTEFDLVNLITNQANDPSLEGRYAVRREYQVAGGDLVAAHDVRCSLCQHKVN